MCADKQNDIPDGDNELYTKQVLLTRTSSWLNCSWHLKGVRDELRSQLRYNSLGGDQSMTRKPPTLCSWGSHPTEESTENKEILNKKRLVYWQWWCKKKMGIKPRTCNDMGVCRGGEKQTLDKWTHNVCHDPFMSVSKTDCDGIRHTSKTNDARER